MLFDEYISVPAIKAKALISETGKRLNLEFR